MRVAAEMGNVYSNFGHSRPLSSRIIRYVRDGRTDRQIDGQTDGQTQRLLRLPYGGRHNNRQLDNIRRV